MRHRQPKGAANEEAAHQHHGACGLLDSCDAVCIGGSLPHTVGVTFTVQMGEVSFHPGG